MEKKEDKIGELRRQVIQAAKAYKDNLAGKVFLYVYGACYFEVVFQTDQFLHLTGVGTSLRARDFYQKAKDLILSILLDTFSSRNFYAACSSKS